MNIIYDENTKTISINKDSNNIVFNNEDIKAIIKQYFKYMNEYPTITGTNEMDDILCPNCEHNFGTLEMMTYYNDFPKFCSNCGQPIKW